MAKKSRRIQLIYAYPCKNGDGEKIKELLNKVEEPEVISCEQCSKTFKTNFMLKRHGRMSCVKKVDITPVTQEPEIESEPVTQETEVESEQIQELDPAGSNADETPNLDLLGFPTEVAQAPYRYSAG